MCMKRNASGFWTDSVAMDWHAPVIYISSVMQTDRGAKPSKSSPAPIAGCCNLLNLMTQ